MEIIDRYVYAVTKRLPESQREDIEKELKTIIEDMMEEHGEEESVEVRAKKVLLELGDPAILSENYRGTKRYLIGPDNYDNYITMLKIVFSAIFIGLSVAVIVTNIFSFEDTIPKVMIDYISTLLSALFQGFAWVTVSFAIAEYYGVNEFDKKKEHKEWDLSELPQIPAKKATISRWELLFEVIFSTIFTIVFCFIPEALAAYIPSSEGTTIIPVFNIELLLSYRIFFIIIFILGILSVVLKFISGRWTLKLAITDSVLSIISMVFTLIIFTNVWSVNFAIDIASRIPEAGIDFVKVWGSIKNGILVSIIIVTIIEVVSNMYKGIKYNK
jgi:uncharacterized membrane-anchored protein